MRIVLVATAFAAFALPAYAGAVWSATPVQASARTGIVTPTAVWNCGDSGCHTTSDTAGVDQLSACRGLAAEVGALSAFVTERGAFSAARLKSCNAAAAKPNP